MSTTDSDLTALGARLRLLRTLARLKRGELAILAGVSKTSISYWENGNTRNISLRSMRKILTAIQGLGVICTEEWLLSEKGEDPRRATTPHLTISLESNIDIHSVSCEKEITQFISACNSQDKVAIVSIENDSMSPTFAKDDIVGGIFVPTNTLDLTKERFCIIKMNGKLDVRRVRRGKTQGKLDLSYLSYDEHTSSPFEISDVTLEMLAPIIRTWR